MTTRPDVTMISADIGVGPDGTRYFIRNNLVIKIDNTIQWLAVTCNHSYHPVSSFCRTCSLPEVVVRYVVQQHTPQEDKMTTKQDRIKALERFAMKQMEEAARLAALPDEPPLEYDKPSVIYFEKQFSPGGRVYQYAAVRTGNGLWYTTGPAAPKGYTWDALIQWIDEGAWPVLRRATKFKPLD